MIVHIKNPHEDKKTEAVAEEMIGKRAFLGWPFLREGLVAAVSDSLFKYEKMTVIPGKPPKVISNPHSPQGLGLWKSKAERIEHMYSKRFGVITGDIDVLVHVRPLKGLKRLDTGAFVKDYEGADKEAEAALQMTLSEVMSEDPRFMEKEAPPLSEEFPDGSKVFFLGEHAYGVAAQVSATTQDSLSVVLAFFPSDKAENDDYKAVVTNRTASRYFPSFKVADMVGLSSKSIAKVTSSFMVVTSDGQKVNLGLSLKFEAKSMKVIDYSRKNGRYWEFSEKAVELIRDYKLKYPEVFQKLDFGGDAMARATEVFPGPDADARAKEVRTWLNTKGVRDFEPVSLFCDQLKKETVGEIEKLSDRFTTNRSPAAIKKAIVKGIPRQAVLKPAHAVYRLQNQHFALGDRVTMVQDSGAVPLSAKGVVIGLNAKSMDVIWDVPFMAGTTLGDRCSQYRGSSVEFNTCLNLTNPQYIASTKPKAAAPPSPPMPFKPRIGPYPAVRPPSGQAPAAGFRPAPVPAGQPSSVHILANPNRGPNGRGGAANGHVRTPTVDLSQQTNGSEAPAEALPTPSASARGGYIPRGNIRGGPRGGFNPGFRGGRGGFISDRGRGAPRGGQRGRGRGGYVPPLASS
ncbi:hypothetical protein JAAARDRAFT_137669 [Jaapia argillacea MUCL 33604]|uniref:Uncharacterized protein n=1 Tax=Jaapia argillacea MUCL 33604 TaxID=933084 RepID=A0A067PH61_9AGAM|nr:hypothetical protein JAAARDRAFT_137669 [Jaapia argillacea MUCL 33604]